MYQQVRIDRSIGCGAVWLYRGDLETLAPEAYMRWLGDLQAGMTGRMEESH
jgi:Zn-finger nucleic acid-binding protein